MKKQTADPPVPPTDEPDELTPFERFERLTRAMLAVPRQEIDAQPAEETVKEQKVQTRKQDGN